MKPLAKELRNKFERTIERARETAEEAARVAFEQLGVGEASPYSYLSEDERVLRRRLRAHGRNLGDVRDSKTETQEIDRLVEEIAYEHWHRMIFARFLAENDLLMYYEDDDIVNAVPVTLSDCDELAQELGLKNGWEMAAKLATKMLPQVFRADSPVFKVVLSAEKQKQLENLVSGIEHDVFKAADSLGWAYQFWQAKKKKEVNDFGNKIGARELPVVTQLFTEPYMVNYLLDNTLGAWWAKYQLAKMNTEMLCSKEELRKSCSLPSVPLEYLQFVKDDSDYWTPAAGSFDGWPSSLSELKLIDPSCGSGHFLVAVFLMLVPMRMELEGLTAKDACDAVLNDNLHGLEIDKRCVEVAAFAVALTAWKYPNSGGFRTLPELKIAWSGQSVNVKKEEWLDLADDDLDLKMHMEELYDLFKYAPVLGSLINPRIDKIDEALFNKDWERVSRLLLTKLNSKKKNDYEFAVVAQGIEKGFQLLGDKYHWIITNVPYLGMRKQNSLLKNYCKEFYDIAKSDLATVFLSRYTNDSLIDGGIYSVVTPSALLNKDSYKLLRKEILEKFTLNNIALLGPNAFETISGEIVDVILISITKTYKKNNTFHFIDVSTEKDHRLKAFRLSNDEKTVINQDHQYCNPDYRIQKDDYNEKKLLIDYCQCPQGIKTGDDDRWVKSFWELDKVIKNTWNYCQSSSKSSDLFSGYRRIINWSTSGDGMIRPRLDSPAIGKKTIGLSQTGSVKPTMYLGDKFDSNIAPILPLNEDNVLAVLTFCTSTEFSNYIEENNRGLYTTNTALMQVPFDLVYWKEKAEKKYPNGLPQPYSNDPIQWIFHGHPSESLSPLQVIIARLLGYRWPAELDSEMELSYEAKALVKGSERLLLFADKDGIVCIPSVRGEAPASERLLNLLAAAYKDEDINMILSELLSDADHTGKSLESWLRDKFFSQHYKLFGHRPFIWQIWDGLKDGFSALVNYHKLDRKNLETLIYTYLGDWISKQKMDMVDGVEGAEEKLNAAVSLKKKLELILEGEAPYDIFIRWKPLNKQPLGWAPDLNDGVRINIRPFMTIGDVGKKGAGVLRDKPNIKWSKDRGKDTENSPWYHLFGGDRINDHHLTLEEKKKARERNEVKYC